MVKSWVTSTIQSKLTLSPCHGRLPLRKYMNICPRASKSSLLLCSENKLCKKYITVNLTYLLDNTFSSTLLWRYGTQPNDCYKHNSSSCTIKKKRLWKVKMIFFGLSKLLRHLPVSILQFNFVANIEYSTPATNSNR